MRGSLLILLTLCLIAPSFGLLPDRMAEINNYMSKYNAGQITAPELVVYVEHIKDKMYEALEKTGTETFTESEIRQAFGSLEPPIERIFTTNAFDLVFNAHYKLTREYYETEDEALPYVIGYYLRPVLSEVSGVNSSLAQFISDLESAVSSGYDAEELKADFGKLRYSMHQGNDCEAIVSGLLDEEGDWEGGTVYSVLIDQELENNCYGSTNCTWVCEEVEDCWDECHDEEVCTGGEGNESPECHWESVCEEYCNTWENCYDDCVPVEVCDPYVSGELKLKAYCGPEHSDLFIEAYGPASEQFNYLNDINWEGVYCIGYIDAFVNMRKALQDSFDQDFVEWYYEEFLGSDYEKIVHGDSGIMRLIHTLNWIDEEIANQNHCWENSSWPAGFEKISIDYSTNSTRLRVWEKRVPVDYMGDQMMWTTLYKHYWFPDKELLKELINYQLSETNTLGVGAEKIAQIKNDEGQMAMIERISGRYGGSFDVRLALVQNGSPVVSKVLQINPDVVLKFSDSISEDPDITITVDYDILYSFLNYMSSLNKEEIHGPSWVRIEEGDEDGLGKVIGVIGMISKLWREGITISPRYALINLIINVFDLFNFVRDIASGAAFQTAQVSEA